MEHVYRLGMLNDYRIFDYPIKCSFSFVSHSILKILRSLLENALWSSQHWPGLIQLFVLCLQPLDAAQVCLLRLPLPHSRPSIAGGTATLLHSPPCTSIARRQNSITAATQTDHSLAGPLAQSRDFGGWLDCLNFYTCTLNATQFCEVQLI